MQLRAWSIGIHTEARHSDGSNLPAITDAMKKYLPLLALIASAFISRGADVIAQWNFNSVPPDGSFSSGSTNPSTGSGALFMVGATTYTFATGHTTDPAGSDNTGINLANFPAQGTSNKTSGIR